MPRASSVNLKNLAFLKGLLQRLDPPAALQLGLIEVPSGFHTGRMGFPPEKIEGSLTKQGGMFMTNGSEVKAKIQEQIFGVNSLQWWH